MVRALDPAPNGHKQFEGDQAAPALPWFDDAMPTRNPEAQLTALAPELRTMIYTYALTFDRGFHIHNLDSDLSVRISEEECDLPGLVKGVSRQIHHEAWPISKRLNTFVIKIDAITSRVNCPMRRAAQWLRYTIDSSTGCAKFGKLFISPPSNAGLHLAPYVELFMLILQHEWDFTTMGRHPYAKELRSKAIDCERFVIKTGMMNECFLRTALVLCKGWRDQGRDIEAFQSVWPEFIHRLSWTLGELRSIPLRAS